MTGQVRKNAHFILHLSGLHCIQQAKLQSPEQCYIKPVKFPFMTTFASLPYGKSVNIHYTEYRLSSKKFYNMA